MKIEKKKDLIENINLMNDSQRIHFITSLMTFFITSKLPEIKEDVIGMAETIRGIKK